MSDLDEYWDAQDEEDRHAEKAKGSSVLPCGKKRVTVVIHTEHKVACPGHSLKLTATGDPPGGTYNWNITGAELVDITGNALQAGPLVYLRGFNAPPENPNIPAQQADVSVEYTYTDGRTAGARKVVNIHGVEFHVSDCNVKPGFIKALEKNDRVSYGPRINEYAILYEPEVEIRLDPSCPRKADCARNHRVGFLQTVVEHQEVFTYSTTTLERYLPVPIRDQIPDSSGGLPPFYDGTQSFCFMEDQDKKKVCHHDAPSLDVTCENHDAPNCPAGPAPSFPNQLRSITFFERFRAWLVVQNIEWSRHDREHSFAFLVSFPWWIELSFDVDMTQPVGGRLKKVTNKCKPHTAYPGSPLPEEPVRIGVYPNEMEIPEYGRGKDAPELGDEYPDHYLDTHRGDSPRIKSLF